MPEMPAKKRTPSCLRIFLITLLLFACIGLAGGFAMVELLPRLAANNFGPIDRGLNIFERALYSARLLIQIDDLITPMDPNAKEPVPFRIENGESVNLIALHLEDSGLIKDASAFRYYLIYSGSDTNLLSGDFSITAGLNAVEIARLLQDANAKDIMFRILAGWRLEEIGAGLAVSGLPISADEFLAAAANSGPGVVPPGQACQQCFQHVQGQERRVGRAAIPGPPQAGAGGDAGIARHRAQRQIGCSGEHGAHQPGRRLPASQRLQGSA